MGNSSSRRQRRQRDPVRVEEEKIVVNKPTAQDCDVNESSAQAMSVKPSGEEMPNCQAVKNVPAETLLSDVCDGKKWDEEIITLMKLGRRRYQSVTEQIEQMKLAINNLTHIRDEFVQFRSKLEFSPGGSVMWTQEGFNQLASEPKFSADEKLIENLIDQVNVIMAKVKEVRNEVKNRHSQMSGPQRQLAFKVALLFLENEIDFNSEGKLVKVEKKNTGANPTST